MSQQTYEYMCDICHDISSGVELEIEGTDKHICPNDHIFCRHHINTAVTTLEQLHQVTFDYYHSDGNYGEIEDLARDMMTKEPVAQMVAEVINASFDAPDPYRGFSDVFCPICTLQEVTDEQLLQYLFIKYKTDRKAIANEIRICFKNGVGLDEYIKTHKKPIDPHRTRLSERKRAPDINLSKFSDEQKMLVMMYALIDENDNRLYKDYLSRKIIDDLLKYFLDYAEAERLFGLEGLEDVLNNYFPSYNPEEKVYELKRRLLLNDLE